MPKATATSLDRLLPLIEVDRTELHVSLSLLEVAEPSLLIEIASNPRCGRYLLGRISDTVAIVDGDQADDLAAELHALGRPPKKVTGKTP